MKLYSPSRIIGALRRRQLDLIRGFIYNYYSNKALSDTVLFESFQGKVIGDNPEAIFREVVSRGPKFDLYFTTNKKTMAPTGSRGVRHGSIKWLKLIATSKVLVNNTNFPGYFRKRKGQIYLQTWHGTPLKKLGRDIEGAKPTNSYLTMMDREASFWDFLISPSKYCTQIFPSAFNYRGEILESGYPRNDMLINNSSSRDRVRESLGIENPDVQVVLYAPTWRDYKRTATGSWKPVNFLPEKLGENVVVLFRGHTNTHDAHRFIGEKNILDVTEYQNVSELYLAADVLVTDYSSVMFDFSVTGKPIIFLAPDFDEYVSARGFYFDFVSEAPGPILRNSDELIQALENISKISTRFSDKYLAWQQKFNHLEDGKSASRVVDRLGSAIHSLF
jgi:CDP-glycerol glycerophosphotransferase